MRVRYATGPSPPRIRPIAENAPEQSQYRQVHIAIFGVTVFNFVAYLMDFIGESIASGVVVILAIAATGLYLALLMRRVMWRGLRRESFRVFAYISAIYLFGLLFYASRMGEPWPFDAALALHSFVWSVTLSGALMALFEPDMIDKIFAGKVD